MHFSAFFFLFAALSGAWCGLQATFEAVGLHVPLQPVAWQRWDNPNPETVLGSSGISAGGKMLGRDGITVDARGKASSLPQPLVTVPKSQRRVKTGL